MPTDYITCKNDMLKNYMKISSNTFIDVAPMRHTLFGNSCRIIQKKNNRYLSGCQDINTVINKTKTISDQMVTQHRYILQFCSTFML